MKYWFSVSCFFYFKTTPHNLKSKLSLPTSAFSFLLSVDLAKSWLLPLAVQQERRPARQELLPKQANITFPNSKAHFHCIVLVISEMISKRGIYIFSRSKKKAPSQVSTCDPGDFAITKCDTRKRLFPCIWRLIIINLIFLFFPKEIIFVLLKIAKNYFWYFNLREDDLKCSESWDPGGSPTKSPITGVDWR